ncbi:glycosyltransferase family 2 protein [Candidatus Woesebacteria bacterium]|nr:glycosyltransferase family 2 protein [Candidatus Woesebacteria bacterium]
MEESQSKLSVALAVYNEAENLAACLDSIKSLASEIVIVDGGSSDKTRDIAASYGAKVIVEENRTNFHINKQHAIDACQNDWILQLDADERVSSMLSDEIRKVITADLSAGALAQADAYYLKRRNYFLGKWMNKGGMYPDPVIRLFRKGRAHLPAASVHELMTVEGTTKWLQNDLLHIADPNFSRYLMRSNRYTSLQAEDWLKENKIGVTTGSIFLYMIWKPMIRFFEIYLRHKGFMDGFPGFVFAWYSGLHIASSYVKYYEQKTAKGASRS